MTLTEICLVTSDSFLTPWTVFLLFMGFRGQEYWSGLLQGIFLGIEPTVSALAGIFLTTEPN